MPSSEVLAVAATAAGLVMAVSPALQVRRMFRTRSSRDVSLGYLALLCVGFVLWMAYGVSIGNAPMMITNTASLTFMVVTIGTALLFRRGDGGRAADGPRSPMGG